jgi:hypothetical protein
LNALRVALGIFSGKYFDKSISAKPAGVAEMLFTARVAPTDRYIFRMNFFQEAIESLYFYCLVCKKGCQKAEKRV